MKLDIMIDPGHGGADCGAVGPTGLKESTCTIQLSERLGALLVASGVSVGYTHTGGGMSLADRCIAANACDARLFLSIHCNASTNPTAAGTETYALRDGGDGSALARAVQRHLVASVGLPDRGVKFRNFQVLRDTAMPAALVEVCFISNPAEESLLQTDAFLDKAAKGIAGGVLAQLGVLPKPRHWAQDSLDALRNAGVPIDEERFEDPIRRGEVFALLDRLMKMLSKQ